jgi:hypothetical protein
VVENGEQEGKATEKLAEMISYLLGQNQTSCYAKCVYGVLKSPKSQTERWLPDHTLHCSPSPLPSRCVKSRQSSKSLPTCE